MKFDQLAPHSGIAGIAGIVAEIDAEIDAEILGIPGIAVEIALLRGRWRVTCCAAGPDPQRGQSQRKSVFHPDSPTNNQGLAMKKARRGQEGVKTKEKEEERFSHQTHSPRPGISADFY